MHMTRFQAATLTALVLGVVLGLSCRDSTKPVGDQGDDGGITSGDGASGDGKGGPGTDGGDAPAGVGGATGSGGAIGPGSGGSIGPGSGGATGSGGYSGTQCLPAGSACSAGPDCCSVSCIGGACSTAA